MTDLELAEEIERGELVVLALTVQPEIKAQIIAALRREHERPPSGEMVMVPREPTDAIVWAICEHSDAPIDRERCLRCPAKEPTYYGEGTRGPRHALRRRSRREEVVIDFKRCPDGMPCSGNCMPFGCQRDARPAASESETPETDALVNSASCSTPLRVGELIDFARSLEHRLSLAQTEIKGHMRIEDDLKAEVVMLNGIIRVRGEAIAKAQARIAELEKDAARYRWLNRQDNFLVDIEHSDGQRTYRLKCGGLLDVWLDARIAIDAALKDRA